MTTFGETLAKLNGSAPTEGIEASADLDLALHEGVATWKPPTGAISSWGQTSNAKFVGSGSPVGVVTPTASGDLYVDETGPGLWQATGTSDTDWQQQGAAPGSAVTRGFTFSFDTPGLHSGLELFTPTPGELLWDAWVSVDVAWDGTTPKGDIGTISDGMFTFAGGAGARVDMTNLARDYARDGSWVGPNLGQDLRSAFIARYVAAPSTNFWPAPLLKYVTTDPMFVWVSTDGGRGGGNPGSTQGSATLYLVTSVPSIVAL